MFTKQCLGRRIDNTDTLRPAAATWAEQRTSQAGVDWQFAIADARISDAGKTELGFGVL